jgi:CheY-like chemotaxis protein
MLNAGEIKTILISEDDPDDQFIFKTALSEVCPQATLKFFFSSGSLIDHLLKNCNESSMQSLPDLIIGDFKVPFFDLKDIAKVREVETCRNIPVIVFAESISEITQSSALELGATEFYYKPHSLQFLKEILSKTIDRKKQPEQVASQGN